jgi:hypothetical protein
LRVKAFAGVMTPANALERSRAMEKANIVKRIVCGGLDSMVVEGKREGLTSEEL